MRRTRLSGSISPLRLLGLGVVCAIAVAYVQPMRAYLAAESQVASRAAEKSALLERRAALERQLAETRTDAFVEREARRLGLVRPGERLFVVKGVDTWDRVRSR
jgi:cell division protein FtsB